MNRHAVYIALRTRAASALPAAREYENVPFTPPATDPYAEEDFAPSGSRLLSGPANGGRREHTGLYVIRWYGQPSVDVSAMNAGITALLARFAPGSWIAASDGTVVRVREEPAPWAGQIVNLTNGRPVATVTIPWLVRTINSF
jgi:hypothetical protein